MLSCQIKQTKGKTVVWAVVGGVLGILLVEGWWYAGASRIWVCISCPGVTLPWMGFIIDR